MSSTIVIVGAGPRGTGVLERLAANAPLLADGELDVHLVDPFPPGAGRIWRAAQSPLLAMNSMAADVTMYTDDSVVCEGPIRPGPSFWEWAQHHADPDALAPELAAELRAVTAATFPSRRLQSEYLGFVLRDVLAGLPPGVRAHLHRTRATGLTEEGAQQVVHLDGEPSIRADVVVLASGHLDAAPTADEQALVATAAARGLRYLPPEQTADSDLSVLEPGETVLVRGMGLAFVDLVALLFEGRGGRFEPEGDELRYVPSGREPRLVVGSPRGMTYHSKTHYGLLGGRPPLPRYVTPELVDELITAGQPVDIRADVWPLMAKEIGWGWYHELFTGHPERVTMKWDDFAELYDAVDWASPDLAAVVAEAVPEPVDRLDLDALESPLAGVTAPDLAALQPIVRGIIAEDLRQHVDPAHTAHLGAFVAMLSTYMTLMPLVVSDVLTPASQAVDVGWWHGFFSSVASGPPGFRVRQMLAIARAGHLDFLGAGMRVEVGDHEFRATSTTLAGAAPVTATAFVDARLPDASLARTLDPLLASLLARGVVAESAVLDVDGTLLRTTGLVRVRGADGAVVDAAGQVRTRLFAAGPHTTHKLPGAFTRPNTNSGSFRHNDALARAVLRSLARAAAAAA